MSESSDLLTVTQAAEYLGVTRQAIHKLTKDPPGLGRCYGSFWMFTREELDRWRARPRTHGGRPHSPVRSARYTSGATPPDRSPVRAAAWWAVDRHTSHTEVITFKLDSATLTIRHGRPMRAPAGRAAELERGGMVFAGSPDEIAERILHLHELLGHTRQILQMDVGGMPHATVLKSIELLGARVLPQIQKELGAH